MRGGRREDDAAILWILGHIPNGERLLSPSL